jgi:hypothetical protein
VSVNNSAPLEASQTFNVLSREADTKRAPSGEKAHASTVLVCRFSVEVTLSAVASQSFRVSDAETTCVPSGEKLQALTSLV